jgi:hypothetical protein
MWMCCGCRILLIKKIVAELGVLLKPFSENVQVERPYICKGFVAKGEEGEVGWPLVWIRGRTTNIP